MFFVVTSNINVYTVDDRSQLESIIELGARSVHRLVESAE
jgi:hypothetical protein